MATIETSRTDVVLYAGILARPPLEDLAKMAREYPASYSRERVMEEADRILDQCLDNAAMGWRPNIPRCVVCDDHGCEFCPAVGS